MTLIAEDLIEFNAISSTVVLIIPQVIAIRNKIFSVQTNLWSIRVSSFFGARRKIKFSSSALSPTLLQPSPMSGVSCSPKPQKCVFQGAVYSCGSPAVSVHLCMISVALEDSLGDRYSVSLRILCLFWLLFLQEAPTSPRGP